MFDQLQKLSAVERLRLYLAYLKTKDSYSPEDQASLEELFEEDV